MATRGPFNVLYPVIFRSGGDTTCVAFGKHIQEFERIYGILTALDNDKLSASDLDGKLSGFKPSMSFSDISGNIDMSRVTGNLDFSRITGNVPADRVVGKLSNANIDTGNVNGLTAFVKALIPPPAASGTGDGITDVDADENGYAKFNNGLVIQWGVKLSPELGFKTPHTSGPYEYILAAEDSVAFPVPFSNQCINIFLSVNSTHNLIAQIDQAWWVARLDEDSLNKAGFNFDWVFTKNDNPSMGGDKFLTLRYFAVGY